MKKLLCYLILLCLLLSCKQRRRTAFDLKPSVIAQIDSSNYTEILWKDSVQSFGTVNEGDSVKLTYTFENTGNRPLFLSTVRPGCGCTVAEFTEDAVLPGHTGFVKAIFNTHGHPGSIFKSIGVTSNTKNKTMHILIFKGQVIRKEQYENK